MKNKLLFALASFFIGTAVQAKSELTVADPVVTFTQNATICPGNSVTLFLTGPANCVAIIRTIRTPYLYSVNIGPAGTGTFTTGSLYETTVFTLESIREIFTLNEYHYNLTVTINVVPNGCTTVFAGDNNGSNTTICSVGECQTLTANPTPIPSTTTYEISSIPYCPQVAFADPSFNQVNITGQDDIWSEPITLPFFFSFFNQTYTTCQIGTNGILSFNSQAYPGFCVYDLNNLTVPNMAFPHKNAIFGVLQDTDIRTVGAHAPSDVSVSWKLTGTYPCRKLIVNFNHLGQFLCDQTVGLQSYQIVLYEISNIIEVYIQNRTRCTTWQNGAGVVGIINATGTAGYVPPVRNTNDVWTASNEAWRFTPNGPNVPMNVRWLEDGNVVANGPIATVCPAVTTSYTAEATYQISGVPYTVTGQTTIDVVLDQTQSPADLSVCNDATGNYVVDLTTNDLIILGALNPEDYEIGYFTTLMDAQLGTNQIAYPGSFAFTQNQTIYARIDNPAYGCFHVKSFELLISDLPSAPIGTSPQTLNAGQTLASLIVGGQNVQWYDAPQDGNLLPNTTVAQNDVTYYATQTVNNCESRTTLSARLAVLVQLTLGTNEFDANAFNLYPNPTSDYLTITSNLENVNLTVFNALSQKIETKTLQNRVNSIDLSNFASGIYLFQLSLEGKTKTYKIVKN
jgi:hypothetical protein